MTEQERNPCGTAHPLPCGLDVACPESGDVYGTSRVQEASERLEHLRQVQELQDKFFERPEVEDGE